MKQFLTALAAFLATTATAERPFELEFTVADENKIYLGLVFDNELTLKLPRAKPPHDMCLECTGWQLVDNAITYDDFTITEVTVGKRTFFKFLASDSTTFGDLVVFENTCNVDGNGDSIEQKTILVGVLPEIA